MTYKPDWERWKREALPAKEGGSEKFDEGVFEKTGDPFLGPRLRNMTALKAADGLRAMDKNINPMEAIGELIDVEKFKRKVREDELQLANEDDEVPF